MAFPSHSPENRISQKDVKIIAVGILLILLIGIYFFGKTLWQDKKRNQADYQNLVQSTEEGSYPTITPESLQKLMATPNEKFTIVDIRPRDMYTLSHLPNALSYPNEDLTAVNLPSTKIIIIGSETDEVLNNKLARYLSDKGVSFTFLKGGMSSWTSANNQIVTTGNPSSFVDQSKIQYVSTDALKTRFQAGEKIFILDVQPAENYRKKHLKDAVNIPFAQLEERIQELPSGQRIVLYGSNEAEAFQAGNLLFDLNIFGAEVIAGDQVLNSGLFTEGQ